MWLNQFCKLYWVLQWFKGPSGQLYLFLFTQIGKKLLYAGSQPPQSSFHLQSIYERYNIFILKIDPPCGHKLTSAGNLGYKLPCSSQQKRREALVHPCLTFSALPSLSHLCVCSPTMTVARGLMGSVHCFPNFR